MNKASRKARTLTRSLTTLHVLEATELAEVAGAANPGDTVGSTSTSGTPSAGDDTVADHILWSKGGFINNHNLTRIRGKRAR